MGKKPNTILVILLVCFIFAAICFVITYPLFPRFSSVMPGFISTDEPYNDLWYSWRIKYAVSRHLSLTHTDLIAYPYGVELYSSGVIAFGWLLWTHLLSICTNPVISHNFQAILNVLLMALSIYLLVVFLTKDRIAGIFSGIIFGFCPYQFVRIWQHLSLTYNQLIVLIVFSALLLREGITRKRSVVFFLSVCVILSFDFSIMYIATISVAAFLMYVLSYNWREKVHKKQLPAADSRYLKRVLLIGLVACAVLSVQFAPIIKKALRLSLTTSASAHNLYHRPFDDLFAQSSKFLSYLLPASSHPVFGKFTEGLIGTPLYGESFTEHTLYLGWIPLALSCIAFRRWKRLRKTPDREERARDDFFIGFFIFLAVVAWLFSQPPWWQVGPLKIFMPSFFMYKILPMYRAYCRFGILLMLAVAVLAGYGLKFVLERFKTRSLKIIIAALFCGLVLFEFWNWPPYKVIDVSTGPAAYYWLKGQDKDIVIAEYPLDSDSPNDMYKFYQTKHEKRIINGTVPGTPANQAAQTIKKLSDFRTARVLRWMGVTYVFLHKEDYLNTGLIEEKEELNKIPLNSGLKFIKSFPPQECPQKNIMCVQKSGPIDVYEVIALPLDPSGLSPNERGVGRHLRK
jgi:hypothetical protein